MTRQRIGNVHGVLTSSILSTDTTWRITYDASSAILTALTSPDYYVFVLEPGTTNQEVVYITSVATTANGDGSYTINTATRGQEGTTQIAHAAAKAWVHGPTNEDYAFGNQGSLRMYGPVTLTNASTIGSAINLFTVNSGDIIVALWGTVNTAFTAGTTIDLGTTTHPTFISTGNTILVTRDTGATTEIQTPGIYVTNLYINSGTTLVATLHGSPSVGSVSFYLAVEHP